VEPARYYRILLQQRIFHCTDWILIISIVLSLHEARVVLLLSMQISTQLLTPQVLSTLFFVTTFSFWLAFPGLAMEEVFRILKPSGGFLIFAEPDYESRIDFPSEFASLGKEQTKSLVKQGVNPRIGRSLPSLASQAGFIECKYGISGYETFAGELPTWWESEWQTIRYDLAETLPSNELDVLMEKDRKSWLKGSRVLWIPTFYLSCRKPPE